jgi:hypothetical protein
MSPELVLALLRLLAKLETQVEVLAQENGALRTQLAASTEQDVSP